LSSAPGERGHADGLAFERREVVDRLSSVATSQYSISWFGIPIATNGAPS
jgi:hypothetical protein